MGQNHNFASLHAYLKQYLKISTGDRVEFVGRIGSIVTGAEYYKFLCGECKQNWNVGTHLFNSKDTTFAIPIELTDWLSDHRHICKHYLSDPSPWKALRCKTCGWGENVHPVPMPDPKDYYSSEFAKSLKHPYIFEHGSAPISVQNFESSTLLENKTLEEHTGRKFR